MQSLADFLGVQDPVDKARPVAPAPSPKMTAADFSKEILDSVQYRESLLRRILMDELPPAIEALLYHYAHGKPVERVEVKDTTETLEDRTVEQLEARALFLAETARRMREDEAANPEPSAEVVH